MSTLELELLIAEGTVPARFPDQAGKDCRLHDAQAQRGVQCGDCGKHCALGALVSAVDAQMGRSGAADVLNMDGGGSTSLVLFDASSGKPRMLNRHRGGVARMVALNLGITFEPEETASR